MEAVGADHAVAHYAGKATGCLKRHLVGVRSNDTFLGVEAETHRAHVACGAGGHHHLAPLMAAPIGQIDVDSDVVNGFDDAEHAAVKEVADALAALL